MKVTQDDWTPPWNRKLTRMRGAPVIGEAEQERRVKIRYRERMYRLREDEYQGRLRAQANACRICAAQFHDDACVDHDHKCCAETPTCGLCTRGLLCARCNSLLGHAQDNIDTLRAAIAYLDTYK